MTNPVPVTPLVDLDDLSLIVGRCKSLAATLQIVMSGSGLPEGPLRDGICYDLAGLIEDLSGKAETLVCNLCGALILRYYVLKGSVKRGCRSAFSNA